jgi:DNA polymerase-3 subunit epsilon
MDASDASSNSNGKRLLLETNWEKLRFVCIDSESTGLNPKRDSIVSLAGVGVCEGEICLFDEFSVVMPVAYNTSSVTVHGITREAASEGVVEPEALGSFLDWLEDGIIVGHHIQHDLTLLNVACGKHFNKCLKNVAVDTMEAFLAVSEAGGFSRVDLRGKYSLDAHCENFNITPGIPRWETHS